jgi:uncharacterized protein YbaP (TraB family)
MAAVLKSWKACMLLALKPLSHWVFGLKVGIDVFQAAQFSQRPILGLAGIAVALALFATFLAF